MSFHEKKSRITFYIKKINNGYVPSCRNIHFDKDFIKPHSRSKGMMSPTRQKLMNKKNNISEEKSKKDLIFDRLTRKKVAEIFQTINMISIAKPPKNSQKNTKKKEAEPRINVIKKSLIEISEKEKQIMRRSSVLNSMNLIPNIYRSPQNVKNNDFEIDLLKEKIKTSINKNSTKLFGFDRLIKGRIEQIFGKGINYKLPEVTVKKIKTNKKRKKSEIKKNPIEMAAHKKKLALHIDDQIKCFKEMENIKYLKENEIIQQYLYNYKVDDLTEDLIENIHSNKRGESFNSLFLPKQNYNAEEEKDIGSLSYNPQKSYLNYGRISDLISKIREFDEEELHHEGNSDKNFQDDISRNLKNQGYYVFSGNEKIVSKPNFPALSNSRKKSIINNFSLNDLEILKKTIKSNSLSQLENKSTTEQTEELGKFKNISDFIKASCLREHKENKKMKKNLREEKNGVLGKLKKLTFKLGYINS